MSGAFAILDTVARRAADALAGASIAAVLLVGASALLLFALRRLPPRLSAALWWLVSLRILLELAGVGGIALPLLPTREAPLSVSRPDERAPTAFESAELGLGAETPILEPRRSAVGPMQSISGGSVRTALVVLWALGVAALIGIELRRARRLAGVVRRARKLDPVENGALAGALEAASAELGLRRELPLLVSDEVATPMVVGLVRPRLLFPAGAPLGGEEARLVLLHELAHVARRDTLFALVPALARRALWFHPFVRFAEREYALATEAACDARVLAATGAEPAGYGRLLVRFAAARDEGLAPACAFAARPLERRLRMLVSTPLDRRRLALVAPLLAVALVAIALPVRLVAAPPATSVVPPVAIAETVEPVENVAPAAEPTAEASSWQPGWRSRGKRPVPPEPPAAPEPPAPPAPRAARSHAVAPEPPTLPAPPAFPATPAAPAIPTPPMPPAEPARMTLPAVTPTPPAAPVVSAAPSAPVPPVPPELPAWGELDDDQAIVFVEDDTSFSMNATASERRRVEELARDGEPVILVRSGGVTRVLRDEQSVAEFRSWLDEMRRARREAAEVARAEAERMRGEMLSQSARQREQVREQALEAREAAREMAAQAREAAESVRERSAQDARAQRIELERQIREVHREVERQREVSGSAARQMAISERDRARLERQIRRELARSGNSVELDLEELIERLLDERERGELPK